MKQCLHFILCILLIAIANISYGQNWLWAKGASGIGMDNGYSICRDVSGNLIVTGSFHSPTITFGPITLVNTDTSNIFIVKYDSSGNVLWAKCTEGTGTYHNLARSVSVDASGNVFITGYFESPVITFGSITLTNNTVGMCSPYPCSYAFVAKYDANGNALWAKSFLGGGTTASMGISTDGSGNAFITGYFWGFTLILGIDTLAHHYTGPHLFIAKYDSNGNLIWGKTEGINDISGPRGYAVSTDNAGNVFLTGHFGSSMTLGSHTLTTTNQKIFIAKYDAGGNVLWAKCPIGPGWSSGYSVDTDINGNASITGFFTDSTLTFGSTTLVNNGGSCFQISCADVFIAKYHANGNPLWVKSAGGNAWDQGFSLTTDLASNTFITGQFSSSSITFGSTTLTPPAGSVDPMFIVKYDSSGNVDCASALASGGRNENGVVADAFGYAYIGGGFKVDPFMVGKDTLHLPNTSLAHVRNVFVAKFSCLCGDSIATIAGNSAICSGQIATLTASGGGTYSWNNGSTADQIFVTPTSTTTYSVIIVIGKCSDTASITVTVYPPLTASISGNKTICSGQSTTLTASGGIVYSWNNGATTSSIIVSPSINTTYSVSVSNGVCTDDTSITIIVHPIPTVIISGNTVPICSGHSATLTASGGGTYLWNNGNTNNAIIVSPSSTTSYSVIVTGTNGCSNTMAATTTVTPIPVATISTNSSICSGDVATLNASGGTTYLWNTGAITSSIQVNPNTATDYSVIVSNGNCSDTAYTSITVNPHPVANVTSNITGAITYGQSVTLTASGGVNYMWSNGSYGNTVIASPTSATVYCVTVTDINNCQDTACVTIAFYDACISGIYLPNAFSPNNDGENDLLQLYYENALCIKSLHIILYNRWGEKVFESSEPAFKWDGTYNRQIMNSQVIGYFMKALLIGGKEISQKGNINLIR